MPYKKTEQKYSGKINECVVGVGDKAITLGGECTLAFLGEEGVGNAPVVGLEIVDSYQGDWADCFKEVYGEDLMKDPAAWAKHIEDNTVAQFIELKFASADPNGDDNSIENCVETAKAVAAATDLPLIIAGCGNAEKDGKLLEEVAKELEGKNTILFSAVEDNYKSIGVAGGMAYGHKVSGESAVDINLAKQLNILLTQLGVKGADLVMNTGQSCVGYGFEYLASTMDRIRLAALGQNDDTLQMPIISPVGVEAWGVKESVTVEEDAPEWGVQEDRGIDMEIATASACLVSGANAVICRHPKAAKVVKEFIKELVG